MKLNAGKTVEKFSFVADLLSLSEEQCGNIRFQPTRWKQTEQNNINRNLKIVNIFLWHKFISMLKNTATAFFFFFKASMFIVTLFIMVTRQKNADDYKHGKRNSEHVGVRRMWITYTYITNLLGFFKCPEFTQGFDVHSLVCPKRSPRTLIVFVLTFML